MAAATNEQQTTCVNLTYNHTSDKDKARAVVDKSRGYVDFRFSWRTRCAERRFVFDDKNNNKYIIVVEIGILVMFSKV